MSRQRYTDKRRKFRMSAIMATGFALIVALSVCIVIPKFLQREEYSELYGVNNAKWIPEESLDFFPADSLASKSSDFLPAVYLRYDDSCPENLKLMIFSVRPDGAQSVDSVNVLLRDKYGQSTGKRGSVLSEQKIMIGWLGDPSQCRMIEICPADTVAGIHNVGMTAIPKNSEVL